MNLVPTAITLTLLLLCAFTLAHSFGMLSGDEARLLAYQNVVSKEPKEAIAGNTMVAFRLAGIFFGISGILVLASFAKSEFRNIRDAALLKWALFSAILAGTLYGGIMRVVANQQGAALLFFFTMLLYLTLDIIEKRSGRGNRFFNALLLLPLYAVFFYTMALPGWAKIFGGQQVIDRYVTMFKDSFVAALPGGTPLVIYALGILELAVPVLLLISLLKGEFRQSAAKTWLSYTLVLSIFTFTILCFGLAILFNFAGSANLVFYPIFTLLLLVNLNPSRKHASSDNI